MLQIFVLIITLQTGAIAPNGYYLGSAGECDDAGRTIVERYAEVKSYACVPATVATSVQ